MAYENHISDSESATRLKFRDALTSKPKPEKKKVFNCSRCFDTGVVSYANGPDDFDWENCNCDTEPIENYKSEYITRKGI